MNFEKKINIQIRVMGLGMSILAVLCGYEFYKLITN